MRAYRVCIDEDEGFILVIIAETSKEARHLAYGHGECDLEWIDIKPIWIKNANIEGLKKGVIGADYQEGLRRGLYSWITGECPICKEYKEHIEVRENGMVSCFECYDKEIIKSAIMKDREEREVTNDNR